VDKKYLREPNPHPEWDEAYCTESTALIGIGKGDLFPRRR